MVIMSAEPSNTSIARGAADPPLCIGRLMSSIGSFPNMPFHILTNDHTGITVSNLERSLAFWHGVLGFEFSHSAHQAGEMAEEITGVEGAELKLTVLKAPGGHKIELLEYLAPKDRKQINVRPCDVGSAHVALTVDDL